VFLFYTTNFYLNLGLLITFFKLFEMVINELVLPQDIVTSLKCYLTVKTRI